MEAGRRNRTGAYPRQFVKAFAEAGGLGTSGSASASSGHTRAGGIAAAGGDGGIMAYTSVPSPRA